MGTSVSTGGTGRYLQRRKWNTLSRRAPRDRPLSGVNERLRALAEAGTSVWLDQIRRGFIECGELQRLVDEYALAGVTSNPSIFEKAIIGSDDYDDDLRALAAEGLDASGIYRRISLRDVQLAADVLRPVWERAHHGDGFVSLEVSPELARDTAGGTLVEARALWREFERPNAMIKIPGTREGLEAIEAATAEGINVNVTLLFSVAEYANVAEAYIRGLERRRDAGEALDIHSVASFFVSRVDTEVDRRLAEAGREDLQGRAGLANARAAYRRFREIFHGERFAELRAAGAPVQRPLWASTGVKNPRYPDTLYVEGLVGPETVNTMPLPTLLAAAEHAEIRGPTAAEDPTETLAALAAAGIDLDEVGAELLEEGIEAFVSAMRALLDGVETRREAVVMSRPPTIDSSIPDACEGVIEERIARAAAEDVARRIWAKDETLWGGPGPEIGDRLGWLTISEVMLEHLDELEAWTGEVAADGLEQTVLLGMGGSSLGPEVLRRSFGGSLHVLDSTDPDAVLAVEHAVDLERTLFVVSSKSGGTLETLSHFHYFWERTGGDGRRFAAVTDPGSPLDRLGEEHGFRRVWLNDPNIGGRYSVMSYFGLVPAALTGAPVRELLRSCQVAEQNCAQFDSTRSNSGLWLGLVLGELARQRRDKVTFVVSPPIESFGLWVEQLVAESTGKRGRGALPVADEPLGPPEDYGADRVFVHLRGDDGLDEPMRALAQAGQPVITVAAEGAVDLGGLFFYSEFAVAVAGWVLEINPFDQPDVQAAKDATQAVLEAGDVGGAPTGTPDDLLAMLDGLAPPHYVALHGYLAPSAEFDAAVAELRAAIRARTRATTTFGYGPRFLHSTGQFHKGGPPVGVFVQLMHDGERDLEIPGAGYSFRTLKHAQALGDLRTLDERGRPVLRLELAGDPAAAVRNLTTRVKEG
jgi:transaldolase / glucose-6-phosphate isomerase